MDQPENARAGKRAGAGGILTDWPRGATYFNYQARHEGVVMQRYFFDSFVQAVERSVVCRDCVGTDLPGIDGMLTEANELIPEIVREHLCSFNEMKVVLSVRDTVGAVVYKVTVDVHSELAPEMPVSHVRMDAVPASRRPLSLVPAGTPVRLAGTHGRHRDAVG